MSQQWLSTVIKEIGSYQVKINGNDLSIGFQFSPPHTRLQGMIIECQELIKSETFNLGWIVKRKIKRKKKQNLSKKSFSILLTETEQTDRLVSGRIRDENELAIRVANRKHRGPS